MEAFDIDFGRWASPQQAYLQQAQGSTALAGSAPSVGGMGAMNTGGFGMNMDTAKLALGGLSTIGNLWNAFQAQKLAKETLGFQKSAFNTNMANQIQTYNTSLADRIRSRGAVEGQSQAQMDDYLSKNSMVRR